MPIMNDREYRDMTIEAKVAEPDAETEDDAKIVQGYATRFNNFYELMSDDDIVIREMVAPTAFDNCDMSDVIMQYNHEGRVFARISNNTLAVEPNDEGLYITADLGGTELGRELYDEIRGGYTTKMSFGFKVSADEWREYTAPAGRRTYDRTITGISRLYDVSAVSIPANDATSISVRGLADGVIQKAEAERLKSEALNLERKKAELRARAIKSTRRI